jgi:hypothetical protein
VLDLEEALTLAEIMLDGIAGPRSDADDAPGNDFCLTWTSRRLLI